MASSESDNRPPSDDRPPKFKTTSFKSMPRSGFRPMAAHRTTLPTPPPSLGSQSIAAQETHTTERIPTGSSRTLLAENEKNVKTRLPERQVGLLQRERKKREDDQKYTRDEAGTETEDKSGQKETGIPESNTIKHDVIHSVLEQDPQLDKGRAIFDNGARDKQIADLQSRKKVMFESLMKDMETEGKAGVEKSRAIVPRKTGADDHSASGNMSSAISSLVKRPEAQNPSHYGISKEEMNRSEYGLIVPPMPTVIDTFHYASAGTRDHTVHLELDVLEDLDEELEEFNRLVRIGSFAMAKSFFDLHLKAHISDPYVFVQYAEMLLEKGDFKSLSAIDSRPIFDGRDSPGDLHPTCGSKQRLELNWRLIRALALCCSQHELHIVWKGLDNLPAQNPRDTCYYGSTELKIMLLTMRLTQLVATPSILGDSGERQLSDWVDWKKLYQQLLSEDRVWDFRDMFLAVSACYGAENALHGFLGYGSSMKDLLADWQTSPQDESTNLALLDLLSLTALATSTYTGVHYLAETCVHLAESIGNSLLDCSPALVQSRPFLRWVVSKAAVNSGPRTLKYFSDYPGLTVFPRIEGMPYYIPVSQETPSWLPLDSTPATRESLHMALQSSRIIQDFKTEALCLRELALRTQDPGVLLHDLSQLQRFKQYNMDGYMVTLLSRYLFCRDYSSKENLRKDIESFGTWKDPSDLVNPTVFAARAVLQHALSQDPEDNAGLSLGSALTYYPYLPEAFQKMIDGHYPAPPSTARAEAHGSPLTVPGEKLPWEKAPEKESEARATTDIKDALEAVNIIPSEDEADMKATEGQHTHVHYASSTESTLSTDGSVSESYEGDTEETDKNGKEASAEAEHMRDSPGRPSGTHDSPTSRPREDSLPQADTEFHLVGKSTTPSDSTTAKGSVEEGNMHSREEPAMTIVSAGGADQWSKVLSQFAANKEQKEPEESDRQPEAD